MRHSGPTSECVPFPGLSVLTMRKVARFKNKQKILTHIYRLAPLTPKPHLSAHRTHCCSHLNGIFRNIINYRDECIRCHFFCLNGEKQHYKNLWTCNLSNVSYQNGRWYLSTVTHCYLTHQFILDCFSMAVLAATLRGKRSENQNKEKVNGNTQMTYLGPADVSR